MKRLIIATLSGMAFGVICYYLFKSGSEDAVPAAHRYQIIASRTLIGFAIGISSVNLRHWVLNGLVLGLIFSIPLSFSAMMYGTIVFGAATFIIGGIYGILIELITSVIFKIKQR